MTSIIDDSQAISEQMMEQFVDNLLGNPQAIDYIERRGLSRNTVSAGKIGFCAPLARFSRAPLMKGRIVVPVRDVHGRIVAFAGRQYEPMQAATERAIWDEYGNKPELANSLIEKWRRGKWINESFPKSYHLFHLDEAKDWARQDGWLALIEGYMDSLVLARRGIPNNAALCGSRLTEFHAAIISRYCRRVVVVMDGDAAGENAVAHIRANLLAAHIIPHILKLPAGFDPDTFALRYGGKQLRRFMEAMITNNEDENQIKIAA